jgi:hypothetical protein
MKYAFANLKFYKNSQAIPGKISLRKFLVSFSGTIIHDTFVKYINNV